MPEQKWSTFYPLGPHIKVRQKYISKKSYNAGKISHFIFLNSSNFEKNEDRCVRMHWCWWWFKSFISLHRLFLFLHIYCCDPSLVSLLHVCPPVLAGRHRTLQFTWLSLCVREARLSLSCVIVIELTLVSLLVPLCFSLSLTPPPGSNN